MQTDNDDGFVPVFWQGLEAWEPVTARVLIDLAGRSATFLDVGANVGIATLLVAAASPSTTVHAFEPVPRVFDRLRRNTELNPELTNIVLHRAGLSNTSGEGLIYVPVSERLSVPTEASLNPYYRPNTDAIPITLVTVDDVVRRDGIDRVDLMKIDTEGAERWIVEGAQRTIARDRPFVVCEIMNTDAWFEADSRQEAYIGPIFFGLGYSAFHLREWGPERCTELRPDPHYRDLNFLFVPTERIHDLPCRHRVAEHPATSWPPPSIRQASSAPNASL
jgi:FkbM family methyltransferase